MLIELLRVCTIRRFGGSLVSISKGPIKCVSLNSHPCQARSTLVTINSDETLFYPFFVSVSKCGGSGNTIDDPYAQVCALNKVKIINLKVFNLISRVSETRFLVHHESCECKCRINESECNSKQKWNDNECQCECKELND